MDQKRTGHSFVVLDDLGKNNLTPWASEVLFTVVNALYAENRMVVITTNWTADDILGQLDYPLASRIFGMCHEIILEPHDYRLAH